jgi:DNA-binding response OmpR family regulator
MRLLIVEDDPVLSSTLSKGLRERAYAVDVAASADDALYLSAINQYDVIVLDVMLPESDGFTVCETIRKRHSEVRILMLTARDALTDRVRGLDSGADDYLTKPFDFDELLARLRALLRRRGDVMPNCLQVGDLEIDTLRQTVVRGGVPIRLTTKEYTLLEYLARNAGKIVGRAEISAHVWDDNYDPASNLIEVYINRVRHKIDKYGPALLHTRRGAGYRLDPDPDEPSMTV